MTFPPPGQIEQESPWKRLVTVTPPPHQGWSVPRPACSPTKNQNPVMFSGRMSLSQPSLLYGQLEELQELAFIERPIRRSLKVCFTCNKEQWTGDHVTRSDDDVTC